MTLLPLLAIAASTAAPDPAPLRASLVRALPPVISMEACAGLQPRFEDRYDRAFDAHRALADEADSLFGAEPAVAPLESQVAAEGCGRRAFAGYEKEAETRLAEARERLAAATAGMRGLWLGTMPVCRTDVEDAKVEPYLDDAMWTLEIALAPVSRERLLAETERRVGERISLRVDGEKVMEPTIHEPLSAGAVSVTAPEREGLERVRSAALRPC